MERVTSRQSYVSWESWPRRSYAAQRQGRDLEAATADNARHLQHLEKEERRSGWREMEVERDRAKKRKEKEERVSRARRGKRKRREGSSGSGGNSVVRLCVERHGERKLVPVAQRDKLERRLKRSLTYVPGGTSYIVPVREHDAWKNAYSTKGHKSNNSGTWTSSTLLQSADNDAPRCQLYNSYTRQSRVSWRYF